MCEVNERTHPPVCEAAAIALAPSGQPCLPASPPLLGSLWLPSTYHPPLAMPGMDSIVSSCPDGFFSLFHWEICTQHGTRFFSTQLPLLPEVDQRCPSFLSKLPDCLGHGQADVTNLH